jgi:hypothetical protein
MICSVWEASGYGVRDAWYAVLKRKHLPFTCFILSRVVRSDIAVTHYMWVASKFFRPCCGHTCTINGARVAR